MSATTPRVWVLVWEDRAYIAGQEPGVSGHDARVWLDTPAWLAWLDAATTTRFAYPIVDPAKGYIVARMTVRKERRVRGGAYWIAYRRVAGHLYKAYVGSASAVTQARLHALARAFLETAADADPDR